MSKTMTQASDLFFAPWEMQHDVLQGKAERPVQCYAVLWAGGHGPKALSGWPRALWACKRATLRRGGPTALPSRVTGAVGAMVQLRPVRASEIRRWDDRGWCSRQWLNWACRRLRCDACHLEAVSAPVTMPRLLLDPSKTLHVPGTAWLFSWLTAGWTS